LYFIKIDEKGTPILIKEERLIAPTLAILTSTINALLQGTSNTTASSYIPTKSVLQQASVSQGIATLDFNENFQYNDFGTAGILAQLYQIVYTCTEITGIDAVQITINNKKIVYLFRSPIYLKKIIL
jgi:spore germination protein GerM